MDARPDSDMTKGQLLTPAEIDALMALPPRAMPSIFVVGDDAVSAITLPRRADA